MHAKGKGLYRARWESQTRPLCQGILYEKGQEYELAGDHYYDLCKEPFNLVKTE
jgi:hypothetical protein